MDLVNEFQSLFTEAPGTTSLAQHHIKLTSDQPVRSRPYPVPYSLRESLKKDVTDMMKMGVIRESSSPYASHVVVVKKKDNTNRVCVDYRKLNKLTVFDPEPMPTAEHLFQKLNGDKYFTRIDLSKGYWQISIPEEDIPKTAFVTPDGSYEFLKMPFGMINSAATLKRAMKKLLYELDPECPFFQFLPKEKNMRYNLRNTSVSVPRIYTDRFKNVFSNRIIFRYDM